MPNPLLRAYYKARRPLGAKRAEALVIPAGALQLHVLRDHVLNPQPSLNLILRVHILCSVRYLGITGKCYLLDVPSFAVPG